MSTSGNSGQGKGVFRLNRQRAAAGRFGVNMLLWGQAKSDSCICEAKQTADHITSGPYPAYRLPEGIQGIVDLDLNTRSWLEGTELYIWMIFGIFTSHTKIHQPG